MGVAGSGHGEHDERNQSRDGVKDQDGGERLAGALGELERAVSAA